MDAVKDSPSKEDSQKGVYVPKPDEDEEYDSNRFAKRLIKISDEKK